MEILAIETSCDETAAAVIGDGKFIRSNIVYSQIDEHKKFGGVVPEIASRRHCENILPVVKEALSQAGMSLSEADAIAVTYAPGLIGALLTGVSFAKGLAFSCGKPLIPVHHIAGHIAANYLDAENPPAPPFIALVASGGHSHIIEVRKHTEFNVIGRARDDAAGEAFDKAARTLGFPYPGGVYIDRAAAEGDPYAYVLPYPKTEGEFDFSFSGLKTAVINAVHNAAQKGEPIDKNGMAASFQRVVSEILTDKTIGAAKRYGYDKIVFAGGVAANSGIRRLLTETCGRSGIRLFIPPVALCSDNAAMIGAQAHYEYLAGKRAGLNLNAYASMTIGAAP